MQNHWILRIQRRLIYAYNDAFDTVIIVDILIVSNIYTGFWGMPCLHWNHTFARLLSTSETFFFILKSILYLIFFAGPFMSYFMNPWHCFFVFVFVFTFQNGHGKRVVVTVPFGHIRSTFPAARSCVWNRIMKLHDGSSKRWRNSSRIWERSRGGVDRGTIKEPQQEWMPEKFFKRMGILGIFVRHLGTIKGDISSLYDWTASVLATLMDVEHRNLGFSSFYFF